MSAPDENPSAGRFERPIVATPADFDELGHVNNVVYLRWVQDIATAHWQAAATAAQLEQLAWVAHRHEIDYKAPGLPGDTFIASTWVGLAESVRFERFVEILRARDRKVLAAARTLWVPISRASGRVTRVDDGVRRVFST
ncbi:MAG: acyl-CoA thioesterase [Gemmatimonadaceae bacterium]